MDVDAPWVAPDGAADYTVLLVFDSLRLDRFVLARHRTRGWELPGGRVEAGESLRAAARREWREETGLPLTRIEPLLLHERPDGSRGHLFLGAMEEDDGCVGENGHRGDDLGMIGHVGGDMFDEKIVEVRLVRRLDEVRPLAFPDDPYAHIAEAVWEKGGDSGWGRIQGESGEAFVARLSLHPEAHPLDHRVVPHPASI